MPTHALLEGFPIVVEIPVAWGDMDAFGHVNNTVFFRYFETARIEFPDTVLVGVRVTELGDDRFTHEYRIVSMKSNEIAADGGVVVVAYDYAQRTKALIPDEIRKRIPAL